MNLRQPKLVVTACLAAYAVLGLAWISLPGPQQDELMFLNAAFPPSMGTLYLAKLQIFRWDIPSMLLPYVGALKGWIWHGLFRIWPPSIYAVRVPAVLLAGVALLLFYLWAQKFYSRGTAALALALAATDPTYIYTARLDWGPVVLGHILKAAGLLLAGAWYRSAAAQTPFASGRRLWLLGAAAFCFGLGLWDKATFIWFLAAASLALLLLFPRAVARCLRPAPAAVFAVCLAAGALPLLVYNYKARREDTTRAWAHMQPLDRVVILTKIENLKWSLDGRSVYGLVGRGEDAPPTEPGAGMSLRILDALSVYGDYFPTPSLWLLGLAVAIVPFAAGWRRQVAFPLLVTGFMWAQMLAAKQAGFSAHHYVLAYPFPQLGIAAATGWAWSQTGHWRKRLAVALMTLLLAANLSWDARYLRLFRLTGGRAFWTDAVYDIAAVLEQRRPPLLLIMDWGFANPLILLTQGRLNIIEYYFGLTTFDPQEDPNRLPFIAGFIRQPNTLCLLHVDGLQEYPGARKLMEEAAVLAGARPRLVRTFFHRDGTPVAVLVGFDLGAGP